MAHAGGPALGLLLLAGLIALGECQDVFSEEGLAMRLTSEHLLLHLRFDHATTASRIHTSFPHAIQHLAATLPLNSVALSLTSGRWHSGDWGLPPLPAKPVGVVLDASFRGALDEATLASHWAALVHALSGLTCVSLGLLRAPVNTVCDNLRFEDLFTANSNAQEGASEFGPPVERRLRALMPHEALCTENLTPWLRLLPCRDQAGLASLLRHRPTVFGSEYVSLEMLIERSQNRNGRPAVRLVQSVTVVVRTSNVPAQHPEAGAASSPVRLEDAMKARVEHFCPAAMRSMLYLPAGQADSDAAGAEGTPADAAPSAGMLLTPLAAAGGGAGGGSLLRSYDTLDALDSTEAGLNLVVPPPQPGVCSRSADAHDPATPGSRRGPLVSVQRFTTGAGLVRGSMVLVVRRLAELLSALPSEASCSGAAGPGGACLAHVVCVHQVLPWYVRPLVHTLELQYDGQVTPLHASLVASNVQPAQQRASPGVLDLCLNMPPRVKQLRLSVAFAKAFLTASEYPPDAHRGFDVPAAVVSFLDPLWYAAPPPMKWRAVDGSDGGADNTTSSPLLVSLLGGPVQEVYTPGLLVPLAAPDFSMPYNVLCMSSTVLAVHAGAIVNLLMRRGGGSKPSRGSGRVVKAAQVLAIACVGVALVVYLDQEVRGKAVRLLGLDGAPK